MRKTILALTGATAAAAALTAFSLPAFCAEASAAQPAKKPNIVIILADDLGYGDVGFTGCKDIHTPNLDRFAATSVRLDNFHVCPICSPTRAGLMTGRYPLRFGLMKAVIAPWMTYGMPTTEKILPQLLAPAGYEERHMIGKWHLGHARLAFLPANRGFTNFYGLYNGAFDYFSHKREGQVDWHRDVPGKTSTVFEKGYSTELMGDEAVKFIGKDHGGKPYLLYVAFNAPHGKVMAKPEDLAKYKAADMENTVADAAQGGKAPKAGKKGKGGGGNVEATKKERAIYAADIDCMDQNAGRIIAAVEKSPDAANTIILFCSDNGGLLGALPYSRNVPYRDGKFSVYEGGIHVAAAIRWPAAGLTGGKSSNALIGYIDVVPTLMTAAGLPLPPKDSPNALDGIDFMPILRGEAPAPVRPWFSYYDQNHNPAASVIEGEWKLVARDGDVLAPGKTSNTTYELYNLAKDPGEKNNLIKENHADIVKKLKAQLTAFGLTAAPDAESVASRHDGEAGFVAPKDWIITTP